MSAKLVCDGFDPMEVQIGQLTPTAVATLFQVYAGIILVPAHFLLAGGGEQNVDS